VPLRVALGFAWEVAGGGGWGGGEGGGTGRRGKRGGGEEGKERGEEEGKEGGWKGGDTMDEHPRTHSPMRGTHARTHAPIQAPTHPFNTHAPTTHPPTCTPRHARPHPPTRPICIRRSAQQQHVLCTAAAVRTCVETVGAAQQRRRAQTCGSGTGRGGYEWLVLCLNGLSRLRWGKPFANSLSLVCVHGQTGLWRWGEPVCPGLSHGQTSCKPVANQLQTSCKPFETGSVCNTNQGCPRLVCGL
jgi:hypothetical protein